MDTNHENSKFLNDLGHDIVANPWEGSGKARQQSRYLSPEPRISIPETTYTATLAAERRGLNDAFSQWLLDFAAETDAQATALEEKTGSFAFPHWPLDSVLTSQPGDLQMPEYTNVSWDLKEYRSQMNQLVCGKRPMSTEDVVAKCRSFDMDQSPLGILVSKFTAEQNVLRHKQAAAEGKDVDHYAGHEFQPILHWHPDPHHANNVLYGHLRTPLKDERTDLDAYTKTRERCARRYAMSIDPEVRDAEGDSLGNWAAHYLVADNEARLDRYRDLRRHHDALESGDYYAGLEADPDFDGDGDLYASPEIAAELARREAAAQD